MKQLFLYIIILLNIYGNNAEGLSLSSDSISLAYHRRNWNKFDKYLFNLEQLANDTQDTFYIAKSMWFKGIGLMKRGQSLNAFSYFTNASDKFIEIDENIESASNLLNMAIIQTSFHDFAGSQETSIEALKLIEFDQTTRALKIKYSLRNNLGIICNEMGLYDESLFWHGLNLADTSKVNKPFKYSLYNNLSVTSLNANYYEEALCYLQEASFFLPHDTTGLNWAYYLDNLSFTQFRQGQIPSQKIFLGLNQALIIRIKNAHREGQIKSYEHLGEYYSFTEKTQLAFLNYEKGYLLCENDDFQKLTMLKGMVKQRPTNNLIKKYIDLNDQLHFQVAQVQNTFALKRYQVQKQKQISVELRSSLSNRELELSKSHNRIIILSSIILVLFLIVVFWMLYQKRLNLINRQKLRIQKLETSEKVQEEISIQLHDDLASEMLYGLQVGEQLSQLHPEINIPLFLDIFEGCYERIRLFSQELQTIDLSKHSFEYYLNYLIIERSQAGGYKVDLQGRLGIFDHSTIFPDTTLKLLYRIFQEIFANISKHSNATLVEISIGLEGDILVLKIINDCITSKSVIEKTGIGLNNLQKQIQLISGKFTYGVTTNQCFFINIKLSYDGENV
ncbi:MAG: hypothetical protein ACPGSD_17445 [Flavobacteriales bacterium]